MDPASLRARKERNWRDPARGGHEDLREENLHAALRIRTVQQYRRALIEIGLLANAREGSPGYARRQTLLADIYHYEMRYERPEFYKAMPSKDGS